MSMPEVWTTEPAPDTGWYWCKYVGRAGDTGPFPAFPRSLVVGDPLPVGLLRSGERIPCAEQWALMTAAASLFAIALEAIQEATEGDPSVALDRIRAAILTTHAELDPLEATARATLTEKPEMPW
jgi:hypothetical protein